MRSVLLMLTAAGTLLAQGDLRPFRMPWNDASPGITSWAPNSSAIGLDAEWVGITQAGHYSLAGRPIRFLGVNIGAASVFPTYERADGHAARLAKFGFNAVRLHHMEAPWDKSNVLINYARGTSRELSPRALDRMHYLVARLAEQGLYTNVNLLVSREFQAADGLGPEITQMGWKDQHILGFFSDEALALHQEYAKTLLTAPNPHRAGRPLAEDPAVAFVEIMNENGLLQKWHEGVLDTMPARYRQQLRDRWNAWLRKQYPTTQAMLEAWGAVDEPLGPNLLINGGFSSGVFRWTLERHNGAAAQVSVEPEFGGDPALRVQVTTPGTANWHVQVNQSALRLQEGQVYTLTFWAKADRPVPLSAVVMRAHTDYASLGPSINARLDSTWREFKVTYTSSYTEPNARVNFNGFGDVTANVWLAAVRLQMGGKLGGIPDGTSLEVANVPSVERRALGVTANQRRDWFKFGLEAEKTYWDTMYRYIKQTLGYKGIVFGTIIANSPPNAQAGLDAFDSHAYWQHPQFPSGQDWNPENWTVANVSMVNDANGGTLGGMARQRVAGRPHNVTEYQHSGPNTYSTEGPLLAAAYAGFQDWDSLWMFAYETTTDEFATGFFDHGGHPGRMAQNLMAAALFRRGDVAPAQTKVRVAFSPSREAELAATRGGAWAVADGSHAGIPASLALTKGVSLVIGEGAEADAELPTAPAGRVLKSDTGELVWDTSVSGKGVVTIDTARTKAVIGFSNRRSFELSGVTIVPGTTRQDWSAIGLTMVEGAGFADGAGGRALLVATGDQANTNMVWKSAARDSVGSRWGTAPVLIEVVPVKVTLPVEPGRVMAWALDARGQRQQEVPVSAVDGKAVLELGISGDTLWYEIAIIPVP